MGVIAMARDNYFILGGIDSRNYDMVVSCEDAFVMPKRDVDTFDVPGRNGELIVDNGRFQNVNIAYQVVIEKDFAEKVNAFKREVGKLRGYVRLEDTFDIDVYRMASVQDIKISELGMRYNGGVFEIKVNCKPQKFLKAGEEPMYFCALDTYQAGNIPAGNVGISTSMMPVPVDGKMRFTMYRISDVAVYYKMIQYDGSGNAIMENAGAFLGTSYTLPVTFEDDATKWVMYVYSAKADDLDLAYIMFEFRYLTDGGARNITAYLKNKISIENPTGYPTNPLIEYLFYGTGTLKITNANIDGTADYYELAIVSSTITKHVFVDCDTQYAYDFDGNNVSDSLRIVTAQGSKGRALVFPRFGDGAIDVEFKTIDGALGAYRPNIVAVYPRWWSV